MWEGEKYSEHIAYRYRGRWSERESEVLGSRGKSKEVEGSITSGRRGRKNTVEYDGIRDEGSRC